VPRRTAADGDITRAALIDAAAELFAAHGIEGVSIRSINSQAGLAPASVHYHFGSKDRLLDAVLERDGQTVRAEISELADRLLARQARPTTRRLVETLAKPYLNLIEREPVRGIRWLKIVAQMITVNDPHIDEDHAVALVSGKVQELVHQRFPGGAYNDIALDWRLGVVTLIQMLSLTPADEITVRFADSSYKQTVVNFVIGGIDASVARGTAARRKKRADVTTAGPPGRRRSTGVLV
jgi:AcrR family transcriptional regulator